MEKDYNYSDLTKNTMGSAMTVHSSLSNGFQEVFYQRALEIELNLSGLNFAREKEVPIFYRNLNIGTRRVDFLVENIIAVELKALSELNDSHIEQGLNYLEAFNLEIDLLINFGSKSLEFKRLLNKKYKYLDPDC